MDYEKVWRPYFVDDALGSAYVVAKRGNIIQKNTAISYKSSLTEFSLRLICLSKNLEEDLKNTHQKRKFVWDLVRKTIHGGSVFCIEKFVSTSFNIVKLL